MNKIFAKTLETLFLGHFWDFLSPSSQAHLNFLFKNWDLSLFLLYYIKLHGKEIEKADDLEIFHCRQIQK